ncbi:MAG: uroporphyrinogen decarboxylase family protein [Planctomycetota bacterium]
MTGPTPSPDNDLVLRAMRGERTERTPVWLMRQAGRFDPAYRQARSEAGLELEALFASPTHAADITVLPLRFGVDAAILFQDILTILGPMGARFVFRPGPVLDTPVTSPAEADRLLEFDPCEGMPFVFDSIGLALERIDGRVPLLGFAGAPMTLLNFLVCGCSPGESATRMLAFCDSFPESAHRLLTRLANITASYLRAKIQAGVHAVQLFESSAAALNAQAYERWALPYQKLVFERLEGTGVPTVLFAKGTDPELMARSGAGVISIGSDRSLRVAKRVMQRTPSGGVQGNLDNELLRNGTPEQIRKRAELLIREGGHRGHVLNLGHGVIRDTPVENVCAMIQAARSCVVDSGVSV